MSYPDINWDTPFGTIKLSVNGSGGSSTVAVPQDVVDVFGEKNVRAAYMGKRMTGERDRCGAIFSLEHVLHADSLVEVTDSEFMHSIKITRSDTVGWLAFRLGRRRLHSDPESNPAWVNSISSENNSTKFDIRHDSNCHLTGMTMLYAASTSQPLQTIPSWFTKL